MRLILPARRFWPIFGINACVALLLLICMSKTQSTQHSPDVTPLPDLPSPHKMNVVVKPMEIPNFANESNFTSPIPSLMHFFNCSLLRTNRWLRLNVGFALRRYQSLTNATTALQHLGGILVSCQAPPFPFRALPLTVWEFPTPCQALSLPQAPGALTVCRPFRDKSTISTVRPLFLNEPDPLCCR